MTSFTYLNLSSNLADIVKRDLSLTLDFTEYVRSLMILFVRYFVGSTTVKTNVQTSSKYLADNALVKLVSSKSLVSRSKYKS